MASAFPKPTPFMISNAVTTGLKIPAVEIDPRLNFVRGAFVFASDIQLLDLKLSSFRKPLEQARDLVVIPSIKMNFEAQGRPQWKQLTQKTMQNRLREGYPRGPILDKSGRLKRAATKKNIWDLTSAVGRTGYDMLALRTEYFDQLVPYAQFHQLGARIPMTREVFKLKGFIGRAGHFGGFSQQREVQLFPEARTGKLPPRPFIQLTLDEEVAIYDIFTAFLTTQVNKYWGMKGDKGL